jgi:hypothetical protein
MPRSRERRKLRVSISGKCLLFGFDLIGVTRSVPESSTMLLAGSGFFGLPGYGRKKFLETEGLVQRNGITYNVEANTKERNKRRRDR